MKNTIKAILSLSLVAILAGCAGKSVPAVSYTGGDPCEYAKQVLARAIEIQQVDSNSIWGPVRGQADDNVIVASRAVKAACQESAPEEDGAWACAEGHSCK